MLSILIPTYNYNCTSLLKELYSQITNSNVEVIVCDDASSNLEIISKNEAHCVKYSFRYLKNNINLGREQTRQKLAQNAANNWLLFMDADVYPSSNEFVNIYLNQLNQQIDVIFGGIGYQRSKSKLKQNLRYNFGIKREEKSLKERLNKPYISINSGCFCIKKNVFLKINKEMSQGIYGLDIAFTYLLKINKIRILHIENKVYHEDLEENMTFFNKSLMAIDTICHLERTQKLPIDYSRIQITFQIIKKSKLDGVVYFFLKLLHTLLKNKALSKKPNLFAFDLYRLYYYIKLKSNA